MDFGLPKPPAAPQEKLDLPPPEKSLKEIFAELSAEFPDEALSIDSSRGFDLTSIKAQYVVERLNDVLTPVGWGIEGMYEYDEPGNVDKGIPAKGGVVFHGFLNIDLNPLGYDIVHRVKAIGYAPSKKNRGDVLKGSKTDAICKAASQLGVGNSVFKGNIAPPSKKTAAKPSTKKPETFKGKTADQDKPAPAARSSRRSR